MSDTDQAYSEVGPYDPAEFILNERRAAIGRGITTLGDDPAKAARSVQLSKATGVDPSLIMPSLDNFEEQHRAALTAKLLNSSDYLRQYIQAKPIHAQISNDDWANLEDLGEKISAFRKTSHEGLLGLPTRAVEGMIGAAWRGFQEGAGEGPIGSWLSDDMIKNHKLASSIAATGALPIEVAMRMLGGGIRAVTEAAREGSKEAYKTFTGDEQGAERFSRDLAGMVELQATGTGVHGAMGDLATTAKMAQELRPTHLRVKGVNFPIAQVEKANEILQKGKLWLDHGEEPPAGVDPVFDKIKLEQNNADVKNLGDMLQSAKATATLGRDRDAIAFFTRLRDDGVIGIDGDAVARLYGDKVPGPEDGLLGFHDRLGVQLEAARTMGGDIEIPLAEFVAHIADNPDLFKLLKDDIRVRPGGITKNEAELAKEQKEVIKSQPVPEDESAPSGEKETLTDPLPSLRASAGLEPLASIGDRKLSLQRREKTPTTRIDIGADEWRLLDENGQKVGWLEVVPYENGTKIYVDNIGGFESKGYGPNAFGPHLVKDLVRQLKELYPEMKEIGGFRISGARERAGSQREVWIKVADDLDSPQGWQTVEGVRQHLEGGEWRAVGVPGYEAYVKPTDLYRESEKRVIDAVHSELARIAPTATPEVVADLRNTKTPGQAHRGLYLQYEKQAPIVMWSLASPDPVGVGRHEAIHHLRREGFFTPKEWDILTRAARDNDWLGKYEIENRYRNLDMPTKLEEAVAEGYRNWVEGAKVRPEVHTLFERLKALIEAIKTKFAEIFGHEPTWEELFGKVDTGEVGRREGAEPLDPRAFRSAAMAEAPKPPPLPQGQPELPGITRMEDRPLYRTPGTIGMSQKQYRLWMQAVKEMHEADVKWSTEQRLKEERKKQTATWKAERKNTKAEVEADFDGRPDVAADIFFARGELHGEKLPQRYKISYEDVTPEERAGLPKEYVAKKGEEGVELDDVAGLVGYPSGRALLDDLIVYNRTKLAANMSAKAFRDRMVELETDRRMKGKFGDLEDNILEAAKEHVTSDTQLNLMAEDVLAIGIKNGLEASIDKAQLRSGVSDRFEELPIAGLKSDKFLRTSGKNALVAEIAGLEGKPDVAIQYKTKQYINMLEAKEAVAFEKDQRRLEKKLKGLAKRDVPGLDLEYQDAIQLLMWQAGVRSNRSMLEIQNSQAKHGNYITDLMEQAAADGWGPNITKAHMAGQFTPLEQMSVKEFREFKDAIDSLNYIGRQVEKNTIAGDKADFELVRREIVDNLKERPRRDYDSQHKGLMHRLYQLDAMITKPEERMAAIDNRKEMGPMVKRISVALAESKHKKFSMQEELGKEIKALNATLSKEWKKSTKEVLPNDWFQDPSDGSLFKIRRSDLINIMTHWGNKSNKYKFTSGYGSPDPSRGATKEEAKAFEAKMKAYIDEHARPDDWKFVQKIWDIYEGYRQESEKVWQNVSGTQPKFYEAQPFDTPHGPMRGGYVPVSRDLFATNARIVEAVKQGPFDFNYPNFNTPQGHLVERTGATYYVDFRSPLTMIPQRMQQVIHDIAFRDSIMASSKILRDNEIRNAIRNHYGREYENTLDEWLLKAARGSNIEEKATQGAQLWMRKMRLNLIQYALPFNYVVNFTPDVGNLNLKAMGRYLKDYGTNKEIAKRLSTEIPHAIYNMDRDFSEAMQKMVNEGKMDAAKTKVARWGYGMATYVSQLFRESVFTDRYQKARMEGKSEPEAATIADVAVRDQFGSVAIHDLPAMMTTGEFGRAFTMFYGYWNNQYNRMRPIPDAIRHGEYMEAAARAWGTVIVGSLMGAFIANQAKEDDSWAKRIGKAIPLQVMGMVPFAREAGTMAFEGIPPRTPLGTVLQSGQAAANDALNWYRGKPIKAGVRHTSAAAGLILGVPGALQLGRTAQGLTDVATGAQRPRDFVEWSRLVLTGEARLKRQGQR